MNLLAKRNRAPIVAFLLGLLVFASAHTLFLPQVALGSTGAPPAHHDLAPHENEEDHFACPTDIHDLSYVRGQDNHTDALDAPVVAASTDYLYPSLQSWSLVKIGREIPHRGVPFDQKTVLLI